MKHLLFFLLFFMEIHTSQSEMYHLNSIEGTDVILYCKHDGKVRWSKGKGGDKSAILTADTTKKIEKHNPDLYNRFSVLDDLSLYIKKVSLSDSGIYNCNNGAVVNLTVTSSGPTEHSNNETSTTISTVSVTSNHNHTEPNSTQVTPVSTENKTISISQSTKLFISTTDLSTTSTSNPEETSVTNTRSYSSIDSESESSGPPTTETSKIAGAVSGVVVFVVLMLLLWAYMKRKYTSAAHSNKKENIYETVDDSGFTAQPVMTPKPNDVIYYLAGDPNTVKIGQRQETEDPTYTLISEIKGECQG